MQAPVFLRQHAEASELALHAALKSRCGSIPEPLFSAMRYALMAGGKRVRPALLIECFLACGGNEHDLALSAAIAIECVHTYSLIHDDLPCMDDDDWRRGMPACHRRFDEATAILAGDALHTLGFELLSEASTTAEIRLQLLHKMAVAIGAQGMVGGQVLDMQAELNHIDNILEVERIHIHKTGALIRFCCEAGALLANADDLRLHACHRYGAAVGLLFQIADDILDATASRQQTGKSEGKDAARGKATYVSLVGLKEAQRMAKEMHSTACEAANQLGAAKAASLVELANYILRRQG